MIPCRPSPSVPRPRPALRAAVLAILLVAFASSIASPARAQDAAVPAGLRGVVLSEDSGRPLEGVRIEIPELRRGTLTDGDGRFSFAGLSPGVYVFRFSAPGYATRTETLRLEPGADRPLRIRLATRPIPLSPLAVLLDRTRMVGDPGRIAEIPGSAHYLNEEDLNRHRQLFDDAHRLLRQVPGINIQEEEGYGLRPNIGMRGAGAERSSKINVMEDGVPIAPAPYSAPAAYYFPVIGRMEAVEIRKGSSQIKYGPHTIGGALNLVSSSIPDELSVRADLQGGRDNTGKVRAKVGDSYRNLGWLFETYQIRTDGFKRLDGGGDTGFEIADYLLKLRVNTDRAARVYQELELKLGLTDELSNETYLGLTDEDFRADPDRRYPASQHDVMDADHRQLQLRHFIRPADRLDVTTTLYRNDFARNWFKLQSVDGVDIAAVLDAPEEFTDALAILRGADSEPDALRVRANNREYYSQGIQTVVGLRLGGERIRNEVELGIRYHADEEDRFQHEDGFRMLGGHMALTSRGAPGSQANRVSDARASALFLQSTMSFGRWVLTPGVRYETIDFTRADFATDDPARAAPTRVRENRVNTVIPGFGASYGLAPGLHLFAGVHKGFSPPGPGAAPETKPEESIAYELGTRYRRGAFNAQVVGFYSDYRNILGRASLATGESGSGDLFNGGAVDVHGLELSARYEPLVGASGLRLPLQLSHTYTRAAFRTSFASDFEPWGVVEAGDRLPYVPEHQVSAGAGLAGERWSARLSAQYSGAMRTVAGQGPIPENRRTDAHLVLDLSGDYVVAPWGSVFVGVQNLTDERHIVARRPAGARPGLPRAVLAGIRFDL